MSLREQDLQRQLDEANTRIARLENGRPIVVVERAEPARNSLQTISDWWHGGSGENARSRHMRMNY